LPPVAELDPKHRVKITIKSLNRNQVSPLIRFHGCKIVGTVRFAPPLVDNYCFRASRRVHNRTVCVENKGCSDWHSPLRPLSEQIHESLATLVVIG
jgi:hypothetical protein